MATEQNGIKASPTDSDLFPDMPDLFDSFDDTIFGDSLDIEVDPLFQEDWKFDETSPHDASVYPTSLSWDSPQTHYPPQEKRRAAFPVVASTLTIAQQEKLRSIAMPGGPESYQIHHSPKSATSTYKSGSVSSLDRRDNTRKRKSSEDDEDDEEGGEDSNPPVKKTAHNMIEKRYRTNLNDKIAALRDSVPSLRVISKSTTGEVIGQDREDLQGLTPAHKLNKATVLAKATEYIRHLEKRNARLTDENTSMKARIAAFEKLFMSGSMGINHLPSMSNFSYAQDNFVQERNNGQMTPDVSPQGMIEVPEDMRRLHAAAQLNQQTYHVPEHDNSQNFRRNAGNGGWQTGGYFGKMMVGSLAGLMILEGYSEMEPESDTPSARGLFGLPTHLLSNLGRSLGAAQDIHVLGYHASPLAFLKAFLLFGALLYVFLPSVVGSKPSKIKTKNSRTSGEFLTTAPSLASPIHVRRQAWLTAVQTVWVPRHNFFLEAAALCLKMLKLSLRNAIGWYGYAMLTGTTEQQELARVKAWSIALDAQLAGGDVEVSKSRLMLTLIASGTLPDTPARLMLKAVHVRILLLEFGRAGFDGFYMFQELASKLARWKWNEAKQLQKLSSIAHAHGDADQSEPLPEYLAALLEQECDDVLVDSVGQRAYNLTWNLPTSLDVDGANDGMEDIVDDFAIRSPLDAVAAWWSTLVLQNAFANCIGDNIDKACITEDIELAIRTAPIGSGAQLRAFVARAVVVDEKRGANIAAALEIIDPTINSETASIPGQIENPMGTLINTKTSIASLPDVHMSVQCAKAIAHLKRSPSLSASTYGLIESIRPAKLGLLGFTACFKLMETLEAHEKAAAACSRRLEDLAGSLRIWIGSGRGGESGLSKESKEWVVERCIGVTKRVVGMGAGLEKDAGYESMSEPEGQ